MTTEPTSENKCAPPDSPALGGSGHRVEQRWWATTLEQCPPGLFYYNGDFGFKTEYQDQNGPEAYCVGSGEYFWGGTNGDKEARRKLLVIPSLIVSNDESSHGASKI